MSTLKLSMKLTLLVFTVYCLKNLVTISNYFFCFYSTLLIQFLYHTFIPKRNWFCYYRHRSFLLIVINHHFNPENYFLIGINRCCD